MMMMMMMMMTFITQGGEGRGKTNKKRKATKSKGRGLEEGASRALMRQVGEEGCVQQLSEASARLPDGGVAACRDDGGFALTASSLSPHDFSDRFVFIGKAASHLDHNKTEQVCIAVPQTMVTLRFCTTDCSRRTCQRPRPRRLRWLALVWHGFELRLTGGPQTSIPTSRQRGRALPNCTLRLSTTTVTTTTMMVRL